MDFLRSYDSLSHEDLIELGQSQQSEIQSLQAANQNLEFKVTALTHELSKLKKLIFGSRSERFIPAEDNTARQGVLDLDIDPPGERTAVSQQITYNRTAVTSSRNIFTGK